MASTDQRTAPGRIEPRVGRIAIVVVLGAIMQLSFQSVRGEDAVYTGLLLIPQSVGAAKA